MRAHSEPALEPADRSHGPRGSRGLGPLGDTAGTPKPIEDRANRGIDLVPPVGFEPTADTHFKWAASTSWATGAQRLRVLASKDPVAACQRDVAAPVGVRADGQDLVDRDARRLEGQGGGRHVQVPGSYPSGRG